MPSGDQGAGSTGAEAAAETPLFGGRIIVHIPSLPENMSYPIENSAVTRRFLYETHESLLLQDWWSHDFVPNAAASWGEEDLVVLTADAPKIEGEVEAQVVRRDGETGLRAVRAVYGKASDGADGVRLEPASKGSSLKAPIDIPAASVERVARGHQAVSASQCDSHVLRHGVHEFAVLRDLDARVAPERRRERHEPAPRLCQFPAALGRHIPHGDPRAALAHGLHDVGRRQHHGSARYHGVHHHRLARRAHQR